MSPKQNDPETKREFTPEDGRLDSLLNLNAAIARAANRLSLFNHSMDVKSIVVEIKALIAQSDGLIQDGLNQSKPKAK